MLTTKRTFDLQTKYGEIKIASSDMLDIKSVTNDLLIQIFERIYDRC